MFESAPHTTVVEQLNVYRGSSGMQIVYFMFAYLESQSVKKRGRDGESVPDGVEYELRRRSTRTTKAPKKFTEEVNIWGKRGKKGRNGFDDLDFEMDIDIEYDGPLDDDPNDDDAPRTKKGRKASKQSFLDDYEVTINPKKRKYTKAPPKVCSCVQLSLHARARSTERTLTSTFCTFFTCRHRKLLLNTSNLLNFQCLRSNIQMTIGHCWNPLHLQIAHRHQQATAIVFNGLTNRTHLFSKLH
jgi:hypothetical protein